jgi:ketosteroid isomerase-like protein
VLKELHDPDAHTCMIHARSTADTKIGPYANEYALFLTFTEDGSEVLRFEEFVDSAYSEKFFAELMK